MIISEQDNRWLVNKYPNLVVTPEGVSGFIYLDATYNSDKHLFLALPKGTEDSVGGRRLSGKFDISIKERIVIAPSRLPALSVENIEHSSNRHFNQTDGTACLGSPLEEDKFLIPQFQFRKYFEELVLPFLYGQLFYSAEARWPWGEYGHGLVGLFESYLRINDPLKAKELLEKISCDPLGASRIRSILRKKEEIKGEIMCFCLGLTPMEICHPQALEGLRQLQRDIEKEQILIKE